MGRRTARAPAVEAGGARRVETGLAFAFGCLALAVVLWLAFRAETLSEQQFEILRVVLALAGGGVAAVIPGFLDVGVQAGAKLALRAGGALAVFVVLYFWSPAHWSPSSPTSITQSTTGANSPAITGNNNVVRVPGQGPDGSR
jgi:hypothetical protein